jgi:hypothetical protein
VDTGTYSNDENYKCFKEEMPKNKRQCRTKIEKDDILRPKIKIRSNNKKRKTKSWKEYCNLTTEANPRNAVYRMAARKKKNYTEVTTLRKTDGSLTKDRKETLRLMLEHFTPEGNKREYNNYHKQVRAITTQPINTTHDSEFKARDQKRDRRHGQ